jgi:transcriptional regulator with XRE-family HTH domain
MKDKRDYESEFARLLQSKRCSLKKTRIIILSVLGVASGTINSWEDINAMCLPSLNKVDKIAEAYELDLVVVKDLLEKAHEQRNQRRKARRTLHKTNAKPQKYLVETPVPKVFRG